VLPTLLGIGALAAFLTTEPWATLLVVGVIYIGSFPFSIRYYRKLKRTADDMRAATMRVATAAGAAVPPGK
jgi:CDP-diacylglycerol--serine O-phosphatidyltransferase